MHSITFENPEISLADLDLPSRDTAELTTAQGVPAPVLDAFENAPWKNTAAKWGLGILAFAIVTSAWAREIKEARENLTSRRGKNEE